MKAIEKGAVIGSAGALLLGASLALSSATAVSGATGTHPNAHSLSAKSTTCSSKSGFCLSVQNTSSGGAIVGTATSNDGLFGQSSTGFGVYGLSASNDGVFGDSSDGVGVSGSSASSDGVDGNAANAGNGVSGKSSSGNGVLGDSSSGAGVSGTSSGGNGVSGTSSFGDAVIGESPSGEGGFFENSTSGFFTLLVENTAAGGYPLMVKNSSTDDSFFVDYAGDGTFTGIVTASGYNTDQPARGGSHLEAFSSESTRATIEDTGTARLESGEGVVRFDSAFESTIDTTRGYQVFLTPKGETRGWLYVAAEYEGGFIVREGLHGRSSVYFDYRVVAHPYGASDARLPQLVIKRPPIQRLPRHTQPQQP